MELVILNNFNFDVDEFIKDYNSNMDYETIMKKYGYKSKSPIFTIIKKLNLKPRTNRWSQEKVEILKTYYPFEEWEELLRILHPFRREDIITKAYKLKIKRECYGFSPEDEQYLLENYCFLSAETIAAKLNKSLASIMTKANKMGLVKMEKWSEEDIEKLKVIYPFYTNEELVEYFPNRTSTGILSMATMKLNLKKDEEHLQEKYKDETKQRLLKELIEYSIELGRTPTGTEINSNRNMAGLMSYHRHFGSYSDACKEAGLEVNSSLFGKSFHLQSKNGDICLSKKEKIITDLLIDNNINYKKEVLYKDILDDDSLKNIRCDWYIDNNLIVEYFGMMEKDYYKSRVEEKLSLCEQNNLKIISLNIKDLSWNFKGLKEKFSLHGINLVV